ncbi:MAG: phosphoribosylglycinamide formyltransferase [Deltaproteobacteria bacterium]|nr:phosphoribosylglycinamide formyltransferase [Deltaproteobacteria bacterium]
MALSPRIALLASHRGTSAEVVMEACATGGLAAKVALVVTNNAGAEVLVRAARFGVASAVVGGAGLTEAERDAALLEVLEASGADWVLLLGYLRRLGPRVLARYEGRLLNTHPSLLPAFGGAGMYGLRVHEAVLASGVAETGVTLHRVTTEYDAGGVVAQRLVAVEAGDTAESLAARCLAAEHAMLRAELPRLLAR